MDSILFVDAFTKFMGSSVSVSPRDREYSQQSISGIGRKCALSSFLSQRGSTVYMFLSLNELITLRYTSKQCFESMHATQYCSKAVETLFGHQVSCPESNQLKASKSFSLTHEYYTSWKKCVDHIYSIRSRFRLSYTVVSTSIRILEKILKQCNIRVFRKPSSPFTTDAELYEMIGCVICFIASKYHDVVPLTLKNLKFYSRNRVYPEDVLHNELSLLEMVDPSAAICGRSYGMHLEVLQDRYLKVSSHVLYKAFVKVRIA